MIWYAQNAEDVVLARVFTGLRDGYYVDVGTGHPVVGSTTKHFYDLGWQGINVEPLVEEIELLTNTGHGMSTWRWRAPIDRGRRVSSPVHRRTEGRPPSTRHGDVLPATG